MMIEHTIAYVWSMTIKNIPISCMEKHRIPKRKNATTCICSTIIPFTAFTLRTMDNKRHRNCNQMLQNSVTNLLLRPLLLLETLPTTTVTTNIKLLTLLYSFQIITRTPPQQAPSSSSHYTSKHKYYFRYCYCYLPWNPRVLARRYLDHKH
jgi:hypothetical protein